MRVLGWSDLGLFSTFEIGHSAADQVCFMSLIQKIGKFGNERQSFYFEKITGTLKINIFVNLPKPSLFLKITFSKKKMRNKFCCKADKINLDKRKFS